MAAKKKLQQKCRVLTNRIDSFGKEVYYANAKEQLAVII